MKIKNCTKCNNDLTINDIYHIKVSTCLKCRDIDKVQKLIAIRTTEIEAQGYKVIHLERGTANNSYPCTVECTSCSKVRSSYYRNIVKHGRKCSCKHSEQYKALMDSKQVVETIKTIPIELKVCGIYSITIKDEQYIGSSVNVQHRLQTHMRKFRDKMHTRKMMKAYLTVTDIDEVIVDVLEECSNDALADREQYYIDVLQPVLNTLDDTANPMLNLKVKMATVCGENNSSSKYSDSAILAMATDLVENRDPKDVANKHGMGVSTVNDLCSGKSYSWMMETSPEVFTMLVLLKGSRIGYSTLVKILTDILGGVLNNVEIGTKYHIDPTQVGHIKKCKRTYMKRLRDNDVEIGLLYSKINKRKDK